MPPPRFCVCAAFLVSAAALALPPLNRTRAEAQSSPNGLPDVAADRAALAKSVPAADMDAVSDGFLVVTPAVFAAPSPSEDARYHWHFAQSAAIYVKNIDAPGLRRAVVVHYEPADRPQALRAARLIARLLALHQRHFGRAAVFHLTDDTADVYLAPQLAPGDGTIGGETRSNQVYIYGTEAISRSAIEWVRTVAHEWGHLTLAAARGFREPENDAAGYLGERLYMKWLRSDETKLTLNRFDDGTTAADLDLYGHRQIEPLIERFIEGGPGSTVLDGATGEAMDYYIGAVLQTDDAYGSAITGKALMTVIDVHARDFLIALRRILASAATFTVRPPAWIPLARGRYSLAVSGGPGAASHSSDGGSGAAGGHASEMVVSSTGWRQIGGINGMAGTLMFTRVSDRTR